MYYCERVIVEAPGKVNLSLDITGATPDGYHMLETVMHSIGLCDIVTIAKRCDDELRVTCSNPAAPENDMNIAYHAAKEFFASTGIAEQGLSIHIEKAIPIEAGLAGGSADAAAVIRGLNRLFETALSIDQLQEIALKSGSDVPFCLVGGCALACGRGERLDLMPMLPPCQIVIAKPPSGMSTKYAFKLYDSYTGEMGRPNTREMVDSIYSGDLAGIGRNMFSVFGQIGEVEVTETLSGIMLCAGALGSVLSGSGSAVIGLFNNERDAKNCLHLLKEQVRDCWVTHPVNQGARIIYEN